jgi:outer membrane protein assembly factor BamB
MTRAITFIPASSGSDGLTYAERASRNRSLHVLVQDCIHQDSSSHQSSRRNFLRNAYREIVSKYVSFGRIEHPLPMVRSLVTFLDRLAKRADCRIDDFRGIGFYALFQDGNTFYLLTSREGRSRIRTGRQFESLATRQIAGVTELPVEPASAQAELFSQDLRDFLALYKIETAQLEVPGQALDLALGGSSEEMDTLLDALDQPGVIEAGVPEKTIPLNLISRKMLYVRFDGLVRMRDLYEAEAARGYSGRGRRRLGMYALSVATVVALVSLGAMWLSERVSRLEPEAGTVISETTTNNPTPDGTPTESATEVVSERGARTDTDAPSDAADTEIRLSLAWEKTYSQPVTSTPLVAGRRVVFGGRDKNLYALDAVDGSVLWRYRAADGIGASPTASGNNIIAADYNGNVFAVGVDDGQRRWNRKLPGKVVSTPCLGEGELLVGCFDGKAYALSVETGRVLWKVATGAKIRASAAFGGGSFFVPSYDGKLYAVTPGSGAVRWTYSLGGPVSSSPAADSARVVVGGVDGNVYAVDARSGRPLWKFTSGAAVKSFLSIAEGKVFAGSNDRSLWCLDADSGSVLWKFETRGIVLGRPALFEDYVVFSSYDGYVYCLNADNGEEVGRFKTNGPVFSSPAIGAGNVYFGNNRGKFYCLKLRGKEAS